MSQGLVIDLTPQFLTVYVSWQLCSRDENFTSWRAAEEEAGVQVYQPRAAEY